MSRVKRLFRKHMQQYRRTLSRVEVIAGRADGTVYVPGTDYQMMYVRRDRNSPPFVVWNKMASVLPGQHLLIGETEYEPRIIQVVDVPLMLGNNNAAIGSVPPHDHGPTSSNPVFIDEWQVIPLRVVPIGDMEVRINGGYVTYKGNIIRVETETIDLTTSIPESGARYSLIRVDTDGVLDVQDGDAVDSFADLSAEAIPVCEDYYLPLAFVKLYYGQTVLSSVITSPDVQMLVWGGSLFVDPLDPASTIYDDDEGDPTDVDATAAADGTSEYAARRDHRHQLGSHEHVEADITDLVHDAESIQGADVPAPEAGDDGKTLVYDHASGDFIYYDFPVDALALDDLTDVNAAAPTEGQVLTWDDDPGEWIAADPTGGGGGGGSGATFTWHIDGALSVVDDVGPAFVAGMDMTLTKVTAYIKTPGTANTTTFDIELNGSSIFTSAPTIAFNDADQLVSVVPDTVDVSAGDLLTLNIDAIATAASSLTVCLFAQAVPEDLNQKQQVIFTVDGELEVAAGALKIPNVTGRTLTLSKVYLIVGTAPVDASLIVDVNIDGTTIFTNQAHRPVILTTATTGSSTDLDVTSWADGSYLTMDIDQIGSTTAGSDLTAVIVYQ